MINISLSPLLKCQRFSLALTGVDKTLTNVEGGSAWIPTFYQDLIEDIDFSYGAYVKSSKNGNQDGLFNISINQVNVISGFNITDASARVKTKQAKPKQGNVKKPKKPKSSGKRHKSRARFD